MRLRKECEHGYYDEHPIYDQDGDFGPVEALRPCPGGEFLPEGALVIEKVDGEWPAWVIETLPLPGQLVSEILDALASQVGESE